MLCEHKESIFICQNLGSVDRPMFVFKISGAAWTSDQVESTVMHESHVLSTIANCYWQGGWRDGGGTETTSVYLTVDL